MRLGSLRTFMIFAGVTGLVSFAIAGPAPVSPGNGGSTTEPVISSAGAASNSSAGTQAAPASSGTGTQAASANPAPDSTDDDSKSNSDTSDSRSDESANVAGTDADGFPILKRKPGDHREKVIELKDGQKLPTSGVDPKFQGSLLNINIDSITRIAPKTDKDRGASNADPRFQSKHLSLTKDGADLQKKSKPAAAHSNEDPSPTPTPSATASPGATSSPSAKSKTDR